MKSVYLTETSVPAVFILDREQHFPMSPAEPEWVIESMHTVRDSAIKRVNACHLHRVTQARGDETAPVDF